MLEPGIKLTTYFEERDRVADRFLADALFDVYERHAMHTSVLLRGVAEVPKMRLLAVSAVGFAAILLMPFRIGEFVRPYMLRAPAHTRDGKAVREVSMRANAEGPDTAPGPRPAGEQPTDRQP